MKTRIVWNIRDRNTEKDSEAVNAIKNLMKSEIYVSYEELRQFCE